MGKRKPSSNFIKAGEAWRAHLNEYRKKHPNMSLKQQMKGAKKTYKKSKSRSRSVVVKTPKVEVRIRPRRSKLRKKTTSKKQRRKKTKKRSKGFFSIF